MIDLLSYWMKFISIKNGKIVVIVASAADWLAGLN